MNHDECIDAGREGCPCVLAEYGKCITCGRLSEGSCEDCNWQGICIYTLYEQGKRQIVQPRKEQLLRIIQIKEYRRDFKVFVVEADKGFCQKAQRPGAFVFARVKEVHNWYDVPISVLKSEPEKGLIHLGICGCGVKSKTLLQPREGICLRGIYYNGLSGLGSLLVKPEVTMVYAKGIAIAPLRNFLDGGSSCAQKLTNLRLRVDLDKIDFDFFRDYYGDLPVEAIKIGSLAEDLVTFDAQELKKEQKSINLFALTSPYYADLIETVYGRKAVRPIEGNLCCGEGICGACTFDDSHGKTLHRCKSRG